MKANLKHKKFLVLLMGLALVFVFIQCSKNVGPIDRDDLILPDGEYALDIVTSNSKTGDAIGAYQIKIQSPSGIQTVSPTSDTYTLTSLVNGMYTFTSIKDGYKGETVEFDVELPDERTADYSAEVLLKLTKLNPPVVVNNTTGGQVVAPPIGNGATGTGSNSATITIPPGAISGTGTTSISFTQIPPTASQRNTGGLKAADTDFGTKTSGFIVLPDGITFTDEVELTFNLNFSPAMLANGITARLYKYTEAGVPTGAYESILISPDGSTGTVSVPNTGYWAIVESWVAPFGTGTYSKLYTSACSEPINTTFTYSKGYGPEYSTRMQIINSTVTVNKSIYAAAALWYTRTASITVQTRNYTMKNKSTGSIIETVTKIPQSAQSYTIKYNAYDCHDSGGHDSGGN